MIHADDDRALHILIDATAEVVGEVSKVYQTIKLAVEGGTLDLLAAARAFDGLPAYQRQRIAEIAAAHADAPRAARPAPPLEEPEGIGFEEPVSTSSAASLLDDWNPRGEASPVVASDADDLIDDLTMDFADFEDVAPEPVAADPAPPTRAAIPDPLEDPWPVHDWELDETVEPVTRQ